MFYKKRIEKLEKEIMGLECRLRILTADEIDKTNICLYRSDYGVEKNIPIADVIKMLLSKLGYEINYHITPEMETYSIQKISAPKKKTKK